MILRKLFYLIALNLFFNSILLSQYVSANVANYLKYGTGFENFGEAGMVGRQKKEYLDNYLDTRFYIQNFSLGFRLDVSNPPEFGLPNRGIRKKFIEFTADGVNLRAGDVYTLFSRGLSLNLFENRMLAYDTGLEGIKAEYQSDFFKAQIVGGEINFLEPSTINFSPPRFEKYNIRAGLVEFSPINMVAFGGSMVWAESNLPSYFSETFDTTRIKIPEFFFKLRIYDFDMFASYAIKNTKIGAIDSSTGNGFYSSVSYTGSGYGITFEYKNYQFDVDDPLKRLSTFRPTRMLPFQNPPIVHKEHYYSLLKRYQHLVDFNDEVGFQIDAFFSVFESFTLNTNFSAASRHHAYEFDWVKFEHVRKNKGNPNLPSFTNERSPFWETFIEAEYYFGGLNSYVKLGFNRQVKINYELFHPTIKAQPLRQTAIPAEIQYVINDEWGIKSNLESQWVSKFPLAKKFYNQLIGFSVSKSPNISFGIKYEFTDNEYELRNQKEWIIIEASYKIGNNHIVTFSYGDERGGQICTSGICREVYPFSGVRFSITSNL